MKQSYFQRAKDLLTVWKEGPNKPTAAKCRELYQIMRNIVTRDRVDPAMADAVKDAEDLSRVYHAAAVLLETGEMMI